MSARRLVGLGAASAAVVATVGCTSVLGLDAPTLDRCTQRACLDATAEGGAVADSPGPDAEPSPEAAPEAAPPEAGGCAWDGAVAYDGGTVRCGGGCYPEFTCSGSTAVCCQTRSDAGALAFACVASESDCTGYSIDCVNENDCSGSEVCCHYSTHTICAQSCTSNGATACLPGSVDDCPGGYTCKPADAGGSPYYQCAQ